MGDSYISYREENGSINISEDVISGIVRTAVLDVEGVSGMSTTAGAELAELIGLKTLPKGVKVHFEGQKIIIDAIITVVYGNNVVNVAKNVQTAVRSVIQASTGFEDAEVNVHVSGISFDRSPLTGKGNRHDDKNDCEADCRTDSLLHGVGFRRAGGCDGAVLLGRAL